MKVPTVLKVRSYGLSEQEKSEKADIVCLIKLVDATFAFQLVMTDYTFVISQ